MWTDLIVRFTVQEQELLAAVVNAAIANLQTERDRYRQLGQRPPKSLASQIEIWQTIAQKLEQPTD